MMNLDLWYCKEVRDGEEYFTDTGSTFEQRKS